MGTAVGAFEACAAHVHDGLVIVEVKRPPWSREGEARDVARCLQRAIVRLRACHGDVDELAGVAVRATRALSGYNRVLVNRFDRDWHETVIAEDKVEFWACASPLATPPHTRDLYALSTMRWVSACDYVPVPLLVTPTRAGDGPVDITFARLRNLSPVHLQSHRNMGVEGTISEAILDEDALWDLVVCHHRTLHRPSLEARATVAALTDSFALRLGPTERAQVKRRRRADMQRMTALLAHMSASEDAATAVTGGPARLNRFFDSGGAMAVSGDTIIPVGRTPPMADLRRMPAYRARGRRRRSFTPTPRARRVRH